MKTHPQHTQKNTQSNRNHVLFFLDQFCFGPTSAVFPHFIPPDHPHPTPSDIASFIVLFFFFGSISISSLCFRINYKASRVVPSYVVSFFSLFFCLGLWSPFGADFYSLSNLSADPATKKREQKIPLSRRMKIFKETNDPEQKKKKRTPFLFFCRHANHVVRWSFLRCKTKTHLSRKLKDYHLFFEKTIEFQFDGKGRKIIPLKNFVRHC